MIPVCKRPELTADFQKWLFIKENFLGHEICDELVRYSVDHSKKITNKVWKSSFETCGLPSDHYIHEKLNSVWLEAIDFFKCSVDFIEEYTINTYRFGNYFSSHVDNYKGLTNKLDRKLTFSLQLSNSDDYRGGDFMVQAYTMPRTKGSIVIFPSNFDHSVSNVGHGTRYSLFTWAWGPVF